MSPVGRTELQKCYAILLTEEDGDVVCEQSVIYHRSWGHHAVAPSGREYWW